MKKEKLLSTKFVMLTAENQVCLCGALAMFKDKFKTSLKFETDFDKYEEFNSKTERFADSYADMIVFADNETDLKYVWMFYGIVRAKWTNWYDDWFSKKKNPFTNEYTK